MDGREKDLVWLHGEVRTPPFSREARIETGVLLRRLQKGEKLSMPQSRPMPSIGAGCHELRIVDRNVAWRLIYFVDSEAIAILEVFDKRTRATPRRVLEDCSRRLKDYKAVSKRRRERPR